MQKNVRQFLILLSFIGISCGAAKAQEDAETARCARSESKVFLPLTGNWKVRWTNRIEPGKYETAAATSRIERDPVGCTLIEHFSSENKKFSEVSLLSFGNKNELQRVYMDSGHGQFLVFNGVQDGEIFRFLWEKNLGERILMLKHEYRKVQANSFETTTWLSTGSGKTWNVVRKSIYERQPKK